MGIVCEKRAAGTLIRVSGRMMDEVSASDLEKVCAERIDDGEHLIVVDFSELDDISPETLQNFVAIREKLMVAGGTMRFCGMNLVVEDIFEMTGLTKVFIILSNVDQAFSF